MSLVLCRCRGFPGMRNPQLPGLCHDVPATYERDAPGGAAARCDTGVQQL